RPRPRCTRRTSGDATPRARAARPAPRPPRPRSLDRAGHAMTTPLALSSSDLALLVTIGVLVLVAAFLSMAETALTRMSSARAQSLADEGRKGARALGWLAQHRDVWLTSLLFTVLACQIVQAVLVGIVA